MKSLNAKMAWVAADLRTRTLDFRGFDSSIILLLRGGILMSIGNFPDILSQAILGIILVGILGVFSVGALCACWAHSSRVRFRLEPKTLDLPWR